MFETAYGVSGMVEERKRQYKSKYSTNNIIGVCLCVLSVIPFFTGVFWGDENVFIMTIMLSVTLVIAGVGVVFFIRNGIIWASYEKLLQEGDYSKTKKKNHSVSTAIFTAYWLIATAIFLAYSFTTNGWEHGWIIWVVAGVLFPAVIGITNVFDKRK